MDRFTRLFTLHVILLYCCIYLLLLYFTLIFSLVLYCRYVRSFFSLLPFCRFVGLYATVRAHTVHHCAVHHHHAAVLPVRSRSVLRTFTAHRAVRSLLRYRARARHYAHGSFGLVRAFCHTGSPVRLCGSLPRTHTLYPIHTPSPFFAYV